jgi:basic amino acid/polyamine antiporter, APA family
MPFARERATGRACGMLGGPPRPNPPMFEPVSNARASESALIRAMGFWALAASIVNVTIGGSIFALPGTLAASMGAAAPLAFVIGAFLFVPITLCFAAAASRATVTGGPYSYVAAAFGPFPGFATAAFLWISSVAGNASLAAISANQAAHVFPSLALPVPRSIFLLAMYALLAALNARGIKLSAAAILIFAAAKVLPLMLLACAGSWFVHWDNLKVAAAPTWNSIGSSLVIVVFAYSGIETALAPSGEVRNPARIVPKAALVGVATVIVLYVGLQWIAQGVLGAALIGNNAPLAAVADRIAPGGGRLLVLVAAVSLFGCMQGDLLGSSRLLYALARDGFLPARIASLTKTKRVPLLAIIGHSLAAWAAASAGSFTTLALVSGGAFCFVYIASCAAAWQLQRRNAAQAQKPLSLPGGPTLPLLGIAGLCGILLTLEREEWFAIGCALVGMTILFACNRWYRHGT